MLYSTCARVVSVAMRFGRQKTKLQTVAYHARRKRKRLERDVLENVQIKPMGENTYKGVTTECLFTVTIDCLYRKLKTLFFEWRCSFEIFT